MSSCCLFDFHTCNRITCNWKSAVVSLLYSPEMASSLNRTMQMLHQQWKHMVQFGPFQVIDTDEENSGYPLRLLCASGSQPVCRGTLVCREHLPSVPQHTGWDTIENHWMVRCVPLWNRKSPIWWLHIVSLKEKLLLQKHWKMNNWMVLTLVFRVEMKTF